MMRQTEDAAVAGRWNRLLVLYWLAMFIGTHIPSGSDAPDGSRIDEFLHFGAFTVLALLVSICWELGGGTLKFRHYMATWFALASYGAVDELLQIPVGRVASVYDWIADLAGAVAGVTLFHLCKPWILPLVRGELPRRWARRSQ